MKPSISHSILTSLLPQPRWGRSASCYFPPENLLHPNHYAAPCSSGHREEGRAVRRVKFLLTGRIWHLLPCGGAYSSFREDPAGTLCFQFPAMQGTLATGPWTSGNTPNHAFGVTSSLQRSASEVTLLGVLKSGCRVLAQPQGNTKVPCPTTLRAPAVPKAATGSWGTCRCTPPTQGVSEALSGSPRSPLCLVWSTCLPL